MTVSSKTFNTDGYVNMMNKYGTMRDASEHYNFSQSGFVPDQIFTAQYEENGLFSKIIDAPAEEALKHGFDLGLKTPDVEEYISSMLEELDFETKAITAIKWARLYGGALAVMIVDDGGELEDELNIERIEKIEEIRIFERPLVTPDLVSMYHGETFGMPDFYDISSMYGRFRVHHSRCLVFKNGILPELTMQPQYRFWGAPEYIRIKRELKDAIVAHGNAPKLLDRAVQAIYKMKNLAATLETTEGEDMVMKRLQAIDMARGIFTSVTIDADGEDYDFKSLTFAGVKEIVDTTCNMLSAVTNIPQTVLFGRSPAGENATGESDYEGWYNYVERIQKLALKGNLTYLLDIIVRAGMAQKKIDKLPKIKLEFNKLWSMTEEEQAEMDSKKASTQQTRAQTAQVYYDMGVLYDKEIRKALAADEDFHVEEMLDDMDDDELWGGEGYEDWEGEPSEGGEEEPPPTGEPSDEVPEQNDSFEKLKENWAKPEGDDSVVEAEIARIIADLAERIKKRDEGNWNDDLDGEIDRIIDDLNKRTKNRASFSKLKEAWGKMKALRNLKWNWGKGENPKNPTADEDSGEPKGVGVLIIKDGKVLCGIRSDNGQLCGAGGHIEDGEEPEAAAIREAQEEFNITPTDLTKLGQLDLEEYGNPYVYLCSEYTGKPKTDKDEMSRGKWLDLKDTSKYADDMFPPFRESLKLLAAQGVDKDNH